MGGSGLSQKPSALAYALRHPRRNAYRREARARGEDRCIACAGAHIRWSWPCWRGGFVGRRSFSTSVGWSPTSMSTRASGERPACLQDDQMGRTNRNSQGGTDSRLDGTNVRLAGGRDEVRTPRRSKSFPVAPTFRGSMGKAQARPRRPALADRFEVVYAGSVTGLYLLEEMARFFSLCASAPERVFANIDRFSCG